jgi:hypothetical protein
LINLQFVAEKLQIGHCEVQVAKLGGGLPSLALRDRALQPLQAAQSDLPPSVPGKIALPGATSPAAIFDSTEHFSQAL